MNLTRYEQETIILWNEEEAQAEIYTASPLVAAWLEKLSLTPYRVEGPGRFLQGFPGSGPDQSGQPVCAYRWWAAGKRARAKKNKERGPRDGKGLALFLCREDIGGIGRRCR